MLNGGQLAFPVAVAAAEFDRVNMLTQRFELVQRLPMIAPKTVKLHVRLRGPLSILFEIRHCRVKLFVQTFVFCCKLALDGL